MSRRVVFPDEMSLRRSHRDVERILSGKEPVEGGHESLSLLVQELREAYPERPVPDEVERSHLSAILREAHLSAETSEPEAASEQASDPSYRRMAGVLKVRRRPVLSGLFASLAVKVTAFGLAGLTAFGGVAAAGGLPDPVQEATANVAAHVGFALPSPSENDDTAVDAAEKADEAVEERAEQAREEAEEAPERGREEAENNGGDGNPAQGAAVTGRPAAHDRADLPDPARVPEQVPVAGGASETGRPAVPDHVQLPDEANVPDDVPAGNGAAKTGKPAVPDHVELPEEANVPTTVPVKEGRPDQVSPQAPPAQANVPEDVPPAANQGPSGPKQNPAEPPQLPEQSKAPAEVPARGR